MGAAGALLQVGPLILFFVKKIFFGNTPREAYEATFMMPSFDFGIMLPRMSLLATIAFAYAIIAYVLILYCATVRGWLISVGRLSMDWPLLHLSCSGLAGSSYWSGCMYLFSGTKWCSYICRLDQPDAQETSGLYVSIFDRHWITGWLLSSSHCSCPIFVCPIS